jgi:hypothetical protein
MEQGNKKDYLLSAGFGLVIAGAATLCAAAFAAAVAFSTAASGFAVFGFATFVGSIVACTAVYESLEPKIKKFRPLGMIAGLAAGLATVGFTAYAVHEMRAEKSSGASFRDHRDAFKAATARATTPAAAEMENHAKPTV